jgi:hypothetical protein
VDHLPEFLAAFLRCWHKRDAAACAAFYTPDGVMIDPALDAPIRGTEAIKRYYETVWRQVPDALLEAVCAADDAHGTCWLWRYTGSTDMEPWEVVGASYLRRVDGLIAWDHAVWDLSLVTSDA